MRLSIGKYAEALASSLEKEKDQRKVNRKIQNLLRILVRKKQTKLIKRLHQNFKDIWLKKKGQVEVEITLPYQPEASEKLALVHLLQTALKKKIILKIKVDEKVMGGMKLEFEDYVIDSTIRSGLERLRTLLVNV